MFLTIKSGDYEVIQNGIVLLQNESDDMIFNVQFEDFQFNIILQFTTDENNHQNLKFIGETETNTLKYICYNFNNSLGTGTTKPIEIATYRSRKVYFHFWIYLMASSIRKAEYTFFLGEEVNDGE